MKKILRIAALVILVGCGLTETNGQQPESTKPPCDGGAVKEDPREALWRGFGKVWKYDESKRIEVYAENASLTELCVHCQGTTYIYSAQTGCVQRVDHQKLIVGSMINRITFEEGKIISFFVLWNHGKKELSIGCSK